MCPFIHSPHGSIMYLNTAPFLFLVMSLRQDFQIQRFPLHWAVRICAIRDHPKEGYKKAKVSGRQQIMWSAWGPLVYSAQSRGSWGEASWQPAAPQRGSSDLCSLVTVIGPEGMAWSCSQAAEVLGKGSSLCWNRLLIWPMLSEIWFEFWVVLYRARIRSQWSLSIPSNSGYPIILWTCVWYRCDMIPA